MSDESQKIEVDATEDRILAIESRLLEQEHRPITAISRFIDRKNTYPDPADPRRRAVLKGLVFCILFSPTTVATGGVLLASTSIGVLVWQTSVMQENNELIRDSLVDSSLSVAVANSFRWLPPSSSIIPAPVPDAHATDDTTDMEMQFRCANIEIPLALLCKGKSPFVILRGEGILAHATDLVDEDRRGWSWVNVLLGSAEDGPLNPLDNVRSSEAWTIVAPDAVVARSLRLPNTSMETSSIDPQVLDFSREDAKECLEVLNRNAKDQTGARHALVRLKIIAITIEGREVTTILEFCIGYSSRNNRLEINVANPMCRGLSVF